MNSKPMKARRVSTLNLQTDKKILTGPPSANIESSSCVFEVTFDRQVQKT